MVNACCREMRRLKGSTCTLDDATLQRRLKYLSDRALTSVENMRDLDIKPDIVLYNTVLDVCRQTGHLEKYALPRVCHLWQ